MIKEKDFEIPTARFTESLMCSVDNIKILKKQLMATVEDIVKTNIELAFETKQSKFVARHNSKLSLEKQEATLKCELKNAYIVLNGTYEYTTKLCKDRLSSGNKVSASEKKAINDYLERAENVRVKYLADMRTEESEPGSEE